MEITLLEETFLKYLNKDSLSQGDAERLKVLADLMKYYHEKALDITLEEQKLQFKKDAINQIKPVLEKLVDNIVNKKIEIVREPLKLNLQEKLNDFQKEVENDFRKKPLETMVKLLWGSLDEDQAIKCPDLLGKIFLSQTEQEMREYLNKLNRGDFVEISKFEQVLDKDQAKILAHIIGFEV